jgi:hypothetical protein
MSEEQRPDHEYQIPPPISHEADTQLQTIITSQPEKRSWWDRIRSLGENHREALNRQSPVIETPNTGSSNPVEQTLPIPVHIESNPIDQEIDFIAPLVPDKQSRMFTSLAQPPITETSNTDSTEPGVQTSPSPVPTEAHPTSEKSASNSTYRANWV